ncbi:MAG: OB-fold nucleic acid binding domain-containing protein [Bryobacter sp.]|nr:OB-fold nucleic acid binding domain-containing protein [Bryobacter sp.]
MKSPYISELQVNSDSTGIYLVQAKDIRQKKTGEPFLSLTLADRSGELDAKMWDNVEEVVDTFDKDDFLKVRGRLQLFQNKPQLTIHRLVRVAEAEVDLSDFFPASARNLDEMWAELEAIVRSLGNPHLKALFTQLLADPEIARRLRIAPAAKSIHHAWIGGLLEHVLSLCQLSRLASSHYHDLDLDLLLAGVILHDLGKIYELTYQRSFGYSTEGQLLGHIIIALRILDEKLRVLPAFPPKLRTLLEHMIVSHHGELEYGSPKQPMFLEAMVLHHLDNLDSKVELLRQAVKKDRSVGSEWTGYLAAIERPVLKKDVYLEEGSVEVPAAGPSDSPFASKLKQALN